MAPLMACRRCKKVGFVRFETVVARGSSHRDFYCGVCDHSWREYDEGGSDTLVPGPERPDRSRLAR